MIDPSAIVAATALWSLTFVVFYVWTALALAAVFRKSGEESWKAWVPVLNSVTLFRLGGYSGWLVLLYLVPVAGWVVQILACHRIGAAFGFGVGMTVVSAVLLPLWASIIGFGSARWVGLEAPAGPRRSAAPVDAAAPAPAYAAEPTASYAVVPPASGWTPPPPPTSAATPAPAPASAAVSPFAPPPVDADEVTAAVPGAPAPISAVPLSSAPAPAAAPPAPSAAPAAAPEEPAPILRRSARVVDDDDFDTDTGEAGSGPRRATAETAPGPRRSVDPWAFTPLPESEGFAETSGPVSAVASAPRAGGPRSALSSVSAQTRQAQIPDDPAEEPFDDALEQTVIARRKRTDWSLVPPSGDPVPLTAEIVLVGRRPSPDPQHPGAQLISIDDGTVSKTHARLQLRDDVWFVTDLDSTNGVVFATVLGTEVEATPNVEIEAGSRFLLGDAEIRLTRSGQ